jgi:hypothetical protein
MTDQEIGLRTLETMNEMYTVMLIGIVIIFAAIVALAIQLHELNTSKE